jgi:hypothetical protein
MNFKAMYELYSATVLKPKPMDEVFELDEGGNLVAPKKRWAYQPGVVDPYKQMGEILKFHEAESGYDVGFFNGIKVAMMLVDVEKDFSGLTKPSEPEAVDKEKPKPKPKTKKK